MSPALTFFSGLLLVIIFGWYFATDIPALPNWGTPVGDQLHGASPYPYGYARYGRPFGPPWVPLYDDFNTFDREVALLIRDRKSGQLLYEARANNSGPSADIGYLLPAMFAAAMKDFPGVGPNPRSVTTPITKQ